MPLLSWTQAATLAAAVPPYGLAPADDGDWAFLLPDGRRGCSARGPRREAERRCEGAGDGALLLGLGAGHEWDQLETRGARGLLAVEVDPRALATTLDRWRRLGRGLPAEDAGRVLLAVSDAELCGELARLLAPEHGERSVILRPASLDGWSRHAPRAAELLADLLRRRCNARVTEERLQRNAQANARRLEMARPVAELDGLWGGQAVIVAGAGPSLGTALPLVRERRMRGDRLVAASTALPVLEQADVRPDALVATDPSPLLAVDCVRREEWRDLPLTVFPGTSAELVEAWPGPLWLALPEGPGLRESRWLGRRPGSLRAGCGTVAGPALALAARLSTGRLDLAGVDLSDTAGGYAAGVRRPADLPRPDFAHARRQMARWVGELRIQGRAVGALEPWPDWLPQQGETP